MHKVIQETLEMLDNWSSRLDGHCSQKRADERSDYRQLISLYVARSDLNGGESGEDDEALELIVVTARNLSRSGLSFLHPQSLRTEKIIVALGEDKKDRIYLQSKIVRRRQVHNDLWEFGVQFVGRAIM
ncbi:PilZ domain-containing protein [uncultured Gimesia sp.]|uniref:PilZ domain-containing protein n=1 Tax=uncultured Gimesia sp. TaxID=1678688 RepID=UPI0030D9087B|tara:strand:- start:14735 stop:15121 length:387 start_codon:yes stop_codon:yes gene_type:complete